ncbi:MAG TPA: hypothetical protein VD788_05525, partial [Candidatus Polarisedimenticolaceae bacterium]|nr:hypothetical protein [Candidatus Polarisedimenticolaceae bacterium]
LPLPGAVTVVDLADLPLRRYSLDTIGLMLWSDGFGGPVPALLADVEFHGLFVHPDLLPSADAILRLPPRRR